MSRFRHEYKYMISRGEEEILQIKVSGILMRDSHIVSDGSYFIRSLYFDDYNDRCMFDNENGTDLRSKYRIRYYNDDNRNIYLEKKSKIHGMVKKQTCRLSVEECKKMLKADMPEIRPEMPEEKKKILLEMQLLGLKPKIIVSYERVPFVYPIGNVRITFDRKITSSWDVNHFLQGNYPARLIMGQGDSIFEVKWNELLPHHIKEGIRLDSLRWISFSKYYMCRIYHL